MLTITLQYAILSCGHRTILAPYEIKKIKSGETSLICMECQTMREVIKHTLKNEEE